MPRANARRRPQRPPPKEGRVEGDRRRENTSTISRFPGMLHAPDDPPRPFRPVRLPPSASTSDTTRLHPSSTSATSRDANIVALIEDDPAVPGRARAVRQFCRAEFLLLRPRAPARTLAAADVQIDYTPSTAGLRPRLASPTVFQDDRHRQGPSRRRLFALAGRHRRGRIPDGAPGAAVTSSRTA